MAFVSSSSAATSTTNDNIAVGREESSASSDSSSSSSGRNDVVATASSPSSAYFPVHEQSPVFSANQADELVKHACRRVRRSGVIQTFKTVLQQSSNNHIILKHSDLELDECIGKGSFSYAYAVKSVKTAPASRRSTIDSDRIVVKVLRKKAMENPKMFATCCGDLYNEALMLSALSYSNVISAKAFALGGITAYKNGRHDAFFIVLEKLEATLSRRLLRWQAQRNKLSLKLPSQKKSAKKLAILKEKTKAIVELADALLYIHSQGLIHRDVKPENIGFDLEGNLKVFDFDVARVLPPSIRMSGSRSRFSLLGSVKSSDSETSDDDSEWSSDDDNDYQPSSLPRNEDGDEHRRRRIDPDETFKLTQRIGSTRYMSPECALGQKYNQKTDVYAFGLIIHEILTLEKPFEDIWSVYHEEAVFLEGERPWISKRSWTKPLKDLIEDCWAHKIQARPTMSEVCRTLEQELPNYIQHKLQKKSWWFFSSSRSAGGITTSPSSLRLLPSKSSIDDGARVEEQTIVFYHE